MDEYTIKIISIYIKNYKNIKSGYIDLSDSSNVSSVKKVLSLFNCLVLNNRLPKDYKETILSDKEEMSLILKLSISINNKEQFVVVYYYTFWNKENLMKKESLKVSKLKDSGEYSNYQTYFKCSLDVYDNFTYCSFNNNYYVKLRKMKWTYAIFPSSKYGHSLLFSDVIYKTLQKRKNTEILNILNILRLYAKNIKL